MIEVIKTKDTALTFPGDIADAFEGTDRQKQIVSWIVAKAYEEVYAQEVSDSQQMVEVARRLGDTKTAQIFEKVVQGRKGSVAEWQKAQQIIEANGHRG